MEIGKKIYSQNPGEATKQENNNAGDSVIDADFSETKQIHVLSKNRLFFLFFDNS